MTADGNYRLTEDITNTGNLNGGSYNTVVNLYPGATIGHDVYGGGRGQKAADGVIETVYGGGNQADVTGNTNIQVGPAQ